MHTGLPDYLIAHHDARPREGACVRFGGLRLTVITPCLVRIEQGAFCDAATQVVVRRDLGEYPYTWRVEDGTLTLETGLLRLTAREDAPLESLTIERKAHPHFVWHWGDKALQNLGGTIETLDRVNGDIPLGDGLCAIDGFATLDDSASPAFTEDGWFAPREGCTDVYFFGYGHDYTACVRDYVRLTGEMSMLPAYGLGCWWSRYHAYTQEEYIALMDRFRVEDVPLSVAIVDMDWHLTEGENRGYYEGWTGYTWNRALFPDPKAFAAALHERGLRTALNLHPADGVRSWEEAYPAMARAMGIDPASGERVPCDYLNPAFYKPYFELLHFPLERDGVDFWWMDWQQGSDYRRLVGEKRYKPSPLEDALKPLWLMNHMHYLASMRDGKRGLMFSRFAGPGSQRYPIGFSGDTMITWDSLDFQPYFTVTAANIGYGWWSHDIGGHMLGYRNDELNTRWIQFGVFSPIFRLHSGREIFLGREPWAYGKQAETIIARFMRLRHKLFPYLYAMCRRDVAEQIPLVRPMYHVDPEEPGAYRVRNEYWLGSEMVVAPITRPGDPASCLGCAQVWLPEGVWTDAFTGVTYRGGEFRAYRPLETMPVFLKAGAIVPMQRHEPHGNRLGGSEHLELLIAPGADGRFTLYEDDGESLAYETGAFCETEITLDWTETKATLTIHPAQGDLSLIPDARDYRLILRGFRAGCAFTGAAGETISARWDEETGAYTLNIENVHAARGAAITVRHAEGLTSLNADVERRTTALLTRAQVSLHVKEDLISRVRGTLKNLRTDELESEMPFAAYQETYLPRAILELVHAYQRALGVEART